MRLIGVNNMQGASQGGLDAGIRLAVAAAVNNETVLAQNLSVSPMLQDGSIPLLIEHGRLSATTAYNAALNATDAEVMVFAHQDVYFPHGWENELVSAIEQLNRSDPRWAVLGVCGMEAGGRHVGHVWSSGLGRVVGGVFAEPHPVVSVDELVIVLRRSSGLRFDDELPGFHLYGTDIVQTALCNGFGAYVFHGPVVHNSRPVLRLDHMYGLAYRYMQRKWREHLPIPTTVVPVTPWGWPLVRHRICSWKNRILGRVMQCNRHENPVALAKELGFEVLEDAISLPKNG